MWDFNHSHDNTKVTSIALKSLETKPKGSYARDKLS